MQPANHHPFRDHVMFADMSEIQKVALSVSLTKPPPHFIREGTGPVLGAQVVEKK